MTLPKSITTVTKFSKFLALVMFILLPFIGFFFGMAYQMQIDGVQKVSNPVNYPNPSPTPTPTPTLSPNPDPLANWKTFTNEKLGFSFKYPENYLIVSENDNTVTLGFKQNSGNIERVLDVSTLESKFINITSYQLCSNEINKLPDYPCRAEWEYTDNNTGKPIYDFHGKKILTFQYADGQDSGYAVLQTTETPKIEARMQIAGGGLTYKFNQILSTFNFTK
jgi:hypothetical protein